MNDTKAGTDEGVGWFLLEIEIVKVRGTHVLNYVFDIVKAKNDFTTFLRGTDFVYF